MSVRLASGPVCWGVDVAGDPANPPWAEVLDGIARAGFEWLELGPVGYLPRDAAALEAALGERNLRAAGAFVFEPLGDTARRDELRAAAAAAASLAAAAGAAYVLVIDAVRAPRAATAGRSSAAPRLDAAGRRALADGIRLVAAEAGARGLAALVHPHAGTWIEFADEIAWAAEVAPLCLDSGHCAYAGVDPVATWEALDGRVAALHLKDVDPAARERVVGSGAGFWSGVAAGVFCPLGRGVVDVEALGATARARGFDGWATVEQDRLPGTGDPVGDLMASRERLAAAGLA